MATYRFTITGEVWQAPAQSCPAAIVSAAVNRLQGRSLYKNKSPEELRPLRGVFLLSPGGVGQKEKKPFLSGSVRKEGDLSKVALYPHPSESEITLHTLFSTENYRSHYQPIIFFLLLSKKRKNDRRRVRESRGGGGKMSFFLYNVRTMRVFLSLLPPFPSWYKKPRIFCKFRLFSERKTRNSAKKHAYF